MPQEIPASRASNRQQWVALGVEMFFLFDLLNWANGFCDQLNSPVAKPSLVLLLANTIMTLKSSPAFPITFENMRNVRNPNRKHTWSDVYGRSPLTLVISRNSLKCQRERWNGSQSEQERSSERFLRQSSTKLEYSGFLQPKHRIWDHKTQLDDNYLVKITETTNGNQIRTPRPFFCCIIISLAY